MVAGLWGGLGFQGSCRCWGVGGDGLELGGIQTSMGSDCSHTGPPGKERSVLWGRVTGSATILLGPNQSGSLGFHPKRMAGLAGEGALEQGLVGEGRCSWRQHGTRSQLCEFGPAAHSVRLALALRTSQMCSLDPSHAPTRRYLQHLHFIGEETDARRAWVTCTNNRARPWFQGHVPFEPMLLTSRVLLRGTRPNSPWLSRLPRGSCSFSLDCSGKIPPALSMCTDLPAPGLVSPSYTLFRVSYPSELSSSCVPVFWELFLVCWPPLWFSARGCTSRDQMEIDWDAFVVTVRGCAGGTTPIW